MEMAYDDEGAGQPVLLVHGHPFNRSMWRPQVRWLTERGFRVITPDLRGYGESPVTTGGKTTLDVFATDLRDLLDHLGVDRVLLGGLSMGGQIVLEFHRLYARRLAGLLIADSSARADDEAARQVRRDTAARVLAEGMEPYATQVLPKMMAPANIGALPAVAEQVLGMMKSTSPAGAAAALVGRAERPDYVEMLTKIAVPTLVVVGSEDEFTPVAEAELMAGRIPDATLAVIDGAGHLPNLERPAQFNAALDRFLVKARSASVLQPRFLSHRAKTSSAGCGSRRPMPIRNRSAGTGLSSEPKVLAGNSRTPAS